MNEPDAMGGFDFEGRDADVDPLKRQEGRREQRAKRRRPLPHDEPDTRIDDENWVDVLAHGVWDRMQGEIDLELDEGGWEGLFTLIAEGEVDLEDLTTYEGLTFEELVEDERGKHLELQT